MTLNPIVLQPKDFQHIKHFPNKIKSTQKEYCKGNKNTKICSKFISVISPGCLKCECESNEVFPTLTVVREFAVYPAKIAQRRKEKKILKIVFSH